MASQSQETEITFGPIKRAMGRLARTHRESLRNYQRDTERVRRATKEQQRYEEASKILQIVAKSLQQRAHNQIAAIVTKCLREVFQDDKYLFEIQFIPRRGKTDAVMKLHYGKKILDPEDQTSGGETDVIALALRVAALILGVPARRRLLVLDEPFRFVSKEFRPAVRKLIELLAEELKIQIILVTHDPEFVCGKVIELK